MILCASVYVIDHQRLDDSHAWLESLHKAMHGNEPTLPLFLFLIFCTTKFCFVSTASIYADKHPTRRIVAEVTYDGSAFSGWQLQSSKRSVQGELNEVLSSIYHQPIRVCGASRTDKGVHARGQIIHYDLPESFLDADVSGPLQLINQQLPDDLKIKRCSIAPPGLLDIQIEEGLPWHAIENAVAKHYSYVFTTTSALLDPMKTRYCANLYKHQASLPMDISRFQSALNLFEGTHDFRAFGNRLDIRAKRSEVYSGESFSSVRTIYSAAVKEIHNPSQYAQFSTLSSRGQLEETYYEVDIILDGALYKMLRNVIAGCVEVGYGTMGLDELGCLLGKDFVAIGKNGEEAVENTNNMGVEQEQGDVHHTACQTSMRTDPTTFKSSDVTSSPSVPVYSGYIPSRAENRLVTAPACGLYLEEVFYKEKIFDD